MIKEILIRVISGVLIVLVFFVIAVLIFKFVLIPLVLSKIVSFDVKDILRM